MEKINKYDLKVITNAGYGTIGRIIIDKHKMTERTNYGTKKNQS